MAQWNVFHSRTMTSFRFMDIQGTLKWPSSETVFPSKPILLRMDDSLPTLTSSKRFRMTRRKFGSMSAKMSGPAVVESVIPCTESGVIEEQDADSVILGCTELPLMVKQGDHPYLSSIPHASISIPSSIASPHGERVRYLPITCLCDTLWIGVCPGYTER